MLAHVVALAISAGRVAFLAVGHLAVRAPVDSFALGGKLAITSNLLVMAITMTFGGLRLLAVLDLTVCAAFAVLPLWRETPMVANLLVMTRAVALSSGPLPTVFSFADLLQIIYL